MLKKIAQTKCPSGESSASMIVSSWNLGKFEIKERQAMKVNILGAEYNKVKIPLENSKFLARPFIEPTGDIWYYTGYLGSPLDTCYIRVSEDSVSEVPLHEGYDLHCQVLDFCTRSEIHHPPKNVKITRLLDETGQSVWELSKAEIACECGAQKALGLKPFSVGHSYWCPVYGKLR
jgi:hypothetical protein